jgi:hypothetical protein
MAARGIGTHGTDLQDEQTNVPTRLPGAPASAYPGRTGSPAGSSSRAGLVESRGIDLSYTSSAKPPAVGVDQLVARVSVDGFSGTSSDSHTYTVPDTYRFRPSPMAKAGSLGAGATVHPTLGVSGASGTAAVGGALVYLSFDGTLGGKASAGGQALGPAPVAVLADAGGHVALSYTAGPNKTATDSITAQDSPDQPALVATDRYTEP